MRHRILKKLRSRNGFYNTFKKLILGTIAGQLVLLLISPLLTRLYSPSDFGVYGTYQTLFSLIAVVASFRIELLLPSVRSSKSATSVSILAITITAVFTIVISIVVAILYLNDKAFPYLWTLPIGTLLLGSSNIIYSWALRMKMAKAVGNSRALQAVQAAVLQVTYPFFWSGSLGLILGVIVSFGFGASRIALTFFRRCRRIGIMDLKSGLLLLKINGRSLFFSCTASLIGRASVGAIIPIFGILYGVSEIGFLALTQRVLGLPVYFIGRSASLAYQQFLGRSLSLGQSVRNQTIYLIIYLAIFSISAATIFGLFAPSLFHVVFGHGWQQAGTYSQVLLPMYVMQFIAYPFMQSSVVAGNGKSQLTLEIIRVMLVIILCCAGFYLDSSDISLLASYTCAMCISYTMYIYAAIRNSGD